MNETREEKRCNLITQDIISAVDFFDTMGNHPIKPDRKGFEEYANKGMTWKEYAFEQLKAKVYREKTDFPEAAKNGVDFEKAVYAAINKKELTGSDEFKNVVDAVRGMTTGNKGGINIQIPGVEDICFVYTKEDAIKLPRIVDIKTTAEYKPGKYLSGIQHELYCYRWIKAGFPVDEFQYLIAEWDNYPKIKDLHRERFVSEKTLCEDWDNIESKQFEVFKPEELILDVERKIKEFIDRLKELSLFEAYQEHYCLYPWNGKEVYRCEEVKGEDFGF